jgi:hypothetical protein
MQQYHAISGGYLSEKKILRLVSSRRYAKFENKLTTAAYKIKI